VSLHVLITGASSGLGQAMALAYYQRYGAALKLVLLARRQSLLDDLARQMPDARVIGLSVDVTNARLLQDTLSQYQATHGTPDIVIANAGISAGTSTGVAGDEEVFAQIFATNVLAMVNTFAPFVLSMQARGTGCLVGIASVAGIRGLPGSGAYSASKAATISYLESLRVELRSAGVKVVTIAPGYIATPMTQHNHYPMPFLMPAQAFAKRAVLAIEKARSYVVIPWQMQWVAWLLRLLPNVVFDAAFAKAPRKARRTGAN
jgi:short-subunit dehydrogenase